MKSLVISVVLSVLAQANSIEQSKKSKKYFGVKEPTTTTPDPLMDFSFDDMESGGNRDEIQCNPANSSCNNASNAAVEVRVPDLLLEQLVIQLWDDLGQKYREDPGLYDSRIDPLDVDALLRRPIALRQIGSTYQADVKMHNVSVTGLSTLTMDSVSVSRNENFTDIRARVDIKCPIIAVKGLYNLKGKFGWWLLDSQGVQKFSISIVNVSLALTFNLEMSEPGEKSACDYDGQAHVARVEVPLAYDDVDFRFDKLGSFANQVVNGVGIYFLQTQEELLVNKIRSVIKAKVASLIC